MPAGDANGMRVVYLGHTARLSGAELALVRMLRQLPEVEAHVVLAEEGPLVARLLDVGATVEVLELPTGSRTLERSRVRLGRLPLSAALETGRYTVTLARRLRELGPDLVHANTLKAWTYGGPAAALAGVPVVWHVHDRIADDYLPATAATLLRASARWLPAAVVANSNTTLATLGKQRVRGTVMPYPVEPCRRATRPSDDTFTVGMVGRIAEWKGQDVLLRALARAFPSGRERAVIVGAPLFGEDGYDQSLRRLRDRLNLRGRVVFRGFREDVQAELATFDALVHASVIPEPFGQVVVEGMAAGLPVVAAAAGGPREIIDDERTGLLCPPGDIDALAAALRRLAYDEKLRRRLGSAARAGARAYRPGVVAGQLVAVYREVLSRTEGRR